MWGGQARGSTCAKLQREGLEGEEGDCCVRDRGARVTGAIAGRPRKVQKYRHPLVRHARDSTWALFFGVLFFGCVVQADLELSSPQYGLTVMEVLLPQPPGC